MGLSGRDCPDCGRRVRKPFEKTVTGRAVCPDCANALFMAPPPARSPAMWLWIRSLGNAHA
jgi:ribosomal protein S27AE